MHATVKNRWFLVQYMACHVQKPNVFRRWINMLFVLKMKSGLSALQFAHLMAQYINPSEIWCHHCEGSWCPHSRRSARPGLDAHSMACGRWWVLPSKPWLSICHWEQQWRRRDTKYDLRVMEADGHLLCWKCKDRERSLLQFDSHAFCSCTCNDQVCHAFPATSTGPMGRSQVGSRIDLHIQQQWYG